MCRVKVKTPFVIALSCNFSWRLDRSKSNYTKRLTSELRSLERRKRSAFVAMVMHRTAAVAASLEDELVKMLHQPFYSPNLEPYDYLFLSPRLKITTKGRRYDSSRDTRKSVASILEGIPRKNTRPSRLTHRLLVKTVVSSRQEFTSNKMRRFSR